MNLITARAAPLETDALTLMVEDHVLLDRATLQVERGEVLAVTGGAGAGKTALLGVLADQPLPGVDAAGRARVDGRRLLIAQGGQLAPRRPLALQVAEVVGHHLGIDLRSALRRMADGLDRMGVPAAARRFDLPPEQISQSLRWACLFAMAAAVGPAVLLADSPCAGLDPTVRLRLLHRLADWARAEGVALLLAGRPEDRVDGPADRVLRLRHGRLVPDSAVPPERSAPASPPVGHEMPGSALLRARTVGMAYPLSPGPKGEPRELTVLHGVDLDLRAGETVALLGETGSAKATLARALLCLPPPTAGSVAWMGRDMVPAAVPAASAAEADQAGLRRTRRDLQPLFPDPAASFDPSMTIAAQFAVALESLRPDIPASQRALRIAEALAAAGLPDGTAERWPAGLTAAEAARAGLARALLSGPRALVADEPAATLSAEERSGFLDTLRVVRDHHRLSLVVATEQFAEGLRDADRGIVLLAGHVVESAAAGILLTAPLHPYSRAMLAASRGERPALEGDAPSGLAQPAGCPLRRRCPLARDFCAQAMPPLEEVSPGHRVACHYWDAPEGGAADGA
ncbi:oligopeptide/dipeptide ABC transporter ATP-binding protein [Azospirillum picis]|uniref:Peptide/nickel transport system ATP-binding protein n=1 Tax=Azospirillum picis TaxID=488438 RepID=A0ABU0MDS0_9PROT|nr:oligopeptide/dipeptide ABC transporter ATP-binding protein [Azospirillum picis]MBP2297449.1 peptide/nickel transport system ATP-binding protein [Azospirillum picis]MDQ0531528.1 peptide/nickel transport system ATP-binding protein [Azospirillum picis]